MRILLSILLTISPILGHAQMKTNNKVLAFNRTEGTAVYENYSQNQSFDDNIVGASAISGSAPTITTALALVGRGSLLLSGTANTDQWRIRTKPIPTIVNTSTGQGAGLNGQNCQVKFLYSSAYGGPVTQSEFTGFVANSAGTNISGTQTLTSTYDIANPQAGRTAIFFFPCPYNATAANTYVDLIISHVTGNTSSLALDEMFTQYAIDIGAGIPNNVFSGKLNGSTISDLNQASWITSCTSGNPSTCTYQSNLFGVTPNCSIQPTSGYYGGRIDSQSATSITYRTFVTNTAADQATSVNIVCTKAGADFIQPTVTPNLYNFTNEFSAQFSLTGVVSAENQDFINGNCVVTATSTYTCTFNSNLFSVAPNCTISAANGGSGIVFGVNTVSTSSVVFVSQLSTTGASTAAPGSIHCTRAGADYRPTAQTPLLVGSVTSNATGALRDESVTLNLSAASTVSVTRASSNWYTSFTAATSIITGTWPSNTWSDVPTCTMTCNTSTGPVFPSMGTISTTGGAFICYNTSNVATLSSQIFIRCIGPR